MHQGSDVVTTTGTDMMTSRGKKACMYDDVFVYVKIMNSQVRKDW